MTTIDRIKALAKQQGIKLKFICSSIGVAESFLGDVKNGRLRLSPERLGAIADLLDTTPAYLSGETDDPSPPPEKKVLAEGISEAELKLLALLRSLPDESREEITAAVETLLNAAQAPRR